MTMQTLGASPWPVRAVEHGWHWLKDGAQAALTYFRPSEGKEAEDSIQRWGALATDVVDHQKNLEVRMEIPGVNAKDLNVEISGRHLVVTGERRRDSKRREGTVVVTERAFGRFQRVFVLPDDIVAEKVKARCRDGVLILKLPKRNPGPADRIEVSVQ